jgi:hypothetical protein
MMIVTPSQIGRRLPRIPFSEPATLLAGPQGRKIGYPCHVTDVSELGIRVRTSVAMATGDIVEVLAKDAPKFPLRSRVAWVGKVGSIDYGHAGLEFLSPCPTSFWVS